MKVLPKQDCPVLIIISKFGYLADLLAHMGTKGGIRNISTQSRVAQAHIISQLLLFLIKFKIQNLLSFFYGGILLGRGGGEVGVVHDPIFL